MYAFVVGASAQVRGQSGWQGGTRRLLPRARPRRRQVGRCAPVLGLALAFAALSLAVASGLTQSIDERALLDLHARSGERLTQAIRMLSDIGSGDLIGPVAGGIAGLLLLLGRLRAAVVVVVATAGAAFDPLLKKRLRSPATAPLAPTRDRACLQLSQRPRDDQHGVRGRAHPARMADTLALAARGRRRHVCRLGRALTRLPRRALADRRGGGLARLSDLGYPRRRARPNSGRTLGTSAAPAHAWGVPVHTIAGGGSTEEPTRMNANVPAAR